MAERVVLHVGAMKSGTSYIQSQIFANKALLADQGILVPGRHWGRQVAAVLDVLGRTESRPDIRGAWKQLVEEVDGWRGTAVVSMEFLGPHQPEKIDEIVASFGDTEVVAVLTARDLNRSIAAMWQETVQNGRWWTWHEYLRAVERGRPRRGRTKRDVTVASRTFWRQQNIPHLARNWQQGVGSERFALVTVPPPGAPAERLMERFGAVAGFDPAPLQQGPRVNASVGAASAEVLRRTNAVLAGRDLEFPVGDKYRKRELAKAVLAARAGKEPKIGLPVPGWVGPHAKRMVRDLRRHEVRLEGEWSDLDPVAVPGIDPESVALEECCAAASAGLSGLRERLEEYYPGRFAGSGPDPAPDAQRTGDEQVDALVDALVEAIADLVDRAVALERSGA